MEKRNIVLILTDDQGYGNLRCHGNPYLKTDNLDELCGGSKSFTNFHVSPTCAPTRASLLTGRHEFRCGVTHVKKGRSILNQDNITIPEVLSSYGYQTGIFGKWHLGENYPSRATDRGFKEVFCFGDSCIGSSGDYWGNTKFSPVINHNGAFEATNGYSTDVFFEQAFRWICDVKEGPFFAYIATCVPHAPFNAPHKFTKKYLDMGLDLDVANYYGMIEKLDESFGAFMANMEKQNQLDDTLIIFTSDNGTVFPEVYNAGLRGGKTNTWEGGTRVPFFVRLPGKQVQGEKNDVLSGAKDVFPTILDYCGIDMKPEYGVEGESLMPYIESRRVETQDRMLFTHLGFWNSDEDVHKYKLLRASVRSQEFRYVNEADIDNVFSNPVVLNPEHLTARNWELHDMVNDIGETKDVKEALSDQANEMETAFDVWWESVYDAATKPVHIVVGSPNQCESHLTSYDWYPSLDFPGRTEHSVGMQSTLKDVADWINLEKECPAIHDSLTGSWNVKTHSDGDYEIQMRVLPKEAGDAVKLKRGKACLRIFGKTYSQAVEEGRSCVSFTLNLEEQAGELECWFENQLPNGKALGAFNVYVRPVG